MKTAIIKTTFWDDENFEQLNLDSKLLYFYLLANPTRTLHLITKMNVKIASAYTGLSIDQIEICKKQLEGAGLVGFCQKYYILLKDYVEAKKGRFTTKVIEREDTEIPDEVKAYFSDISIYNMGNYTGTIPEHKDKDKDKNKSNEKDNSKTKEKEIINISEKIDLEELKLSIKETCTKLNKMDFTESEIDVELEKINNWFLNTKKRFTDYQAFTRNWFYSAMDKRKSAPVIIQSDSSNFSKSPEQFEEPEPELTEYEKFQLDPDYNFDKTKRTHSAQPQTISEIMGF